MDAAGFYWAMRDIYKAADRGANKQASDAITHLVNPGERIPDPRRAGETISSYKVLGDEL